MSETSYPAAGSTAELSEEQRARTQFKKKLARNRRKKREAEGEIKELNIVAMMDMMTIILVFLLKSFATSSVSTASSGDIAPPISTTRIAPKDTVAVTITRCSEDNIKAGKCRPGSGTIMVGDKNVATFQDDKVDAAYKQGGENGMLIEPLKAALDKEVEKAKYIAQYNPSAPFTGELSIVGDRNMPYRLLTEVLYTAGQAELDSYRFVVIKKEGGDGGGAQASAE
ncbi:MAG: ExbD/TolR family protein [Myxococcales bacterium]